MGAIVVFGAGGRAGRAAVGEALRRGHRVTAIVRDPGRYGGGGDHREGADGLLTGAGVRLLAGDVTDAGAVARLAAGHDAAIAAVYDPAAPPEEFYPAAARALADGLTRAGVRRLVVVGLGAALETASGTPLMDTPGFPPEYRPLCLGHAAGTAVLRAATTASTTAPAAGLDWLVVSPAGDFDRSGARTGRYAVAPVDVASRVSYADLAVALLDEIDAPRHHRTHIGVAGG
ncbi:NAD(P)-dependent oxidoreductase [Allostreptomyces psammosilenae]|uniref:NAD(P)-binding domain-containing protein n=1 Tax=Allostreptomyces psammosilenae TaxID=1892865 RepID=A0A852ZZ72_9ACTN|nr:NAD(P)H-binding protein [Allostreptomyces psammosilenae]NYI03572.1 hypothetical protein [Allostreptomyces psammosilenae]